MDKENTMNSLIHSFAKTIRQSRYLVFFGGAGVSTPSGIPDFRSAKGLYSQRLHRQFTPEQLISHTFYASYPQEFFAFYKKNLVYPNALPNSCHLALARLEEKGFCKSVVTQNIDSLHQMAGSKNVLELHGSVKRNYCENCRAFYDEKAVLQAADVPYCQTCGGRVKPDVVLYEEPLNQEVLVAAVSEISRADTLVVGGTSLVVNPAASLIQFFKGGSLVVINKTITPADQKATLVIRQDIAEVFSQTMELLAL